MKPIKSTIFIIIIFSLILGCGARFPSQDIAKDIATQIIHELHPNAEIIDIEITNKFTQKIEGETYFVYEFATSYNWANMHFNEGGMQVAYILRGQKWYGKLIREGTESVRGE